MNWWVRKGVPFCYENRRLLVSFCCWHLCTGQTRESSSVVESITTNVPGLRLFECCTTFNWPDSNLLFSRRYMNILWTSPLKNFNYTRDRPDLPKHCKLSVSNRIGCSVNEAISQKSLVLKPETSCLAETDFHVSPWLCTARRQFLSVRNIRHLYAKLWLLLCH